MLTETLIVLDITKTESNNCFIIQWTEKKMEVMFLLLHWQEATQGHELDTITRDLECPWHDYCRICSYDVIGTDFENSLYAFGRINHGLLLSANQKRVRVIYLLVFPQYLTFSCRARNCWNKYLPRTQSDSKGCQWYVHVTSYFTALLSIPSYVCILIPPSLSGNRAKFHFSVHCA